MYLCPGEGEPPPPQLLKSVTDLSQELSDRDISDISGAHLAVSLPFILDATANQSDVVIKKARRLIYQRSKNIPRFDKVSLCALKLDKE